MADHSFHLRNLLNSVLVVTGGVLVGGAVHESLVEGAVAPTNPAVLAAVAVGLVVGLAGYRFRVSPRDARERLGTAERETEADPDEDPGEGADPTAGPLADAPPDGEENA